MSNNLIDSEGQARFLLRQAAFSKDNIVAATSEQFNLLCAINDRDYDGKIGIVQMAELDDVQPI